MSTFITFENQEKNELISLVRNLIFFSEKIIVDEINIKKSPLRKLSKKHYNEIMNMFYNDNYYILTCRLNDEYNGNKTCFCLEIVKNNINYFLWIYLENYLAKRILHLLDINIDNN